MNLTMDITSPIEIRAAGMRALREALGADGAQLFIDQYFGGRGDYTAEKQGRLPMTVAELDALEELYKIGDFTNEGNEIPEESDVEEDCLCEWLNKTKTFGGLHFDIVKRNMTSVLKLEDGTTIDDEYDTVMINDTAVCVVEVKYRVETKDVKKLAKKRVHNFKKLFPMYAGYKIYLAIGGLTFQKGAADAAKELGMGVLRLNGDAVEIFDDNLKVY